MGLIDQDNLSSDSESDQGSQGTDIGDEEREKRQIQRMKMLAIQRVNYYGRFEIHTDPDALEEIKRHELFINSQYSEAHEKVFNGVFYNLDAQSKLEYKYEDES